MDAVRYAIACHDLVGECEYVATGGTLVEVKRALWAHFRDRHPNLPLTAGLRAELEHQMDGLLEAQMVMDRPRWKRYRQ